MKKNNVIFYTKDKINELFKNKLPKEKLVYIENIRFKVKHIKDLIKELIYLQREYNFIKEFKLIDIYKLIMTLKETEEYGGVFDEQ